MTTPFDHRKARKVKNRRRLPWGLKLSRVRVCVQTKAGLLFSERAWCHLVAAGFYRESDRL